MARMFDRSHRRRARLARETRFNIENLERRQVMAANLVASLMPDGVLRVEGTPARDWIEVRQAGGQISVTGAAISVTRMPGNPPRRMPSSRICSTRF
jgi:hypothetical protein